MLFKNAILAVVGFTSYATAHMIMAKPVPFGKSTLNNSPLAADGSDFPCKLRSNTFAAEGANNVMPLGSTQPLAFTGSAVHGGGSCQISITYDATPSKNSVWKVIHSIEGGCPMKGVTGNNGNDANAVDPSTYSFTIPTTLPLGTATLAWSWFNKIGNREMYMNCAPITLTAGSAKRDEDELVARNATMLMERDQAAYNSLPNMFVANVNNGCGTVDSTDLKFPSPGDSLEQLGMQTPAALAAPTGNCAAAVVGAPAVTPSPVVSAAPSNSVPGGVFVTSPAVIPIAPITTAPPAAASSHLPAVPSAVAPSAAAPSSTPAAPVSPGGNAMAAGTACTPEGLWNCMGNSFQRCASGTWSVVQAMAAGTECTVGSSMALSMKASSKRNIRFSPGHLRRHIQRST